MRIAMNTHRAPCVNLHTMCLFIAPNIIRLESLSCVGESSGSTVVFARSMSLMIVRVCMCVCVLVDVCVSCPLVYHPHRCPSLSDDDDDDDAPDDSG